MGIMDNEGHDPQGLGNVLRHSDANDLRWSKTEIALRDDIIRSRDHDIRQLQIALHKDRDEIVRLRTLVRMAYNEGFTEGMREESSRRGGKPWEDSTSHKRLAHEQSEKSK